MDFKNSMRETRVWLMRPNNGIYYQTASSKNEGLLILILTAVLKQNVMGDSTIGPVYFVLKSIIMGLYYMQTFPMPNMRHVENRRLCTHYE